jgi:hypothetical protein
MIREAMNKAMASRAGRLKKNITPLPTEQTAQIKHQMMRRNHILGYSFKMSDGTEYHSTQSGSWKRMTSRRCSNSTNLKHHGVRRRLKSDRTRL